MSISSLSLNNISRASILRIQGEIRDGLKEQSTGRHADVGATLGRLTGNTVTLRAEEASLERMLESNKLVASRFTLMNDAMTAVSASADRFQASLISGTGTSISKEALVKDAQSGLQQVLGALNTDIAGEYLFAGTQSDVRPLRDGSTAVSAAFDDFLAQVRPAGATRASVTSDQLNAYFSDAGYLGANGTTYRFADGFDDVNWDANWSETDGNASQAAISKSETVTTSLSANKEAFRQVAAAYAMVASLGLDGMNDGARAATLTAAVVKLKEGTGAMTALGAEIGMRQKRVELADDALTRQKDIVEAAYSRLEGVDETEALLRIQNLQQQLDASYAVTGKLQSLSILNYI